MAAKSPVTDPQSPLARQPDVASRPNRRRARTERRQTTVERRQASVEIPDAKGENGKKKLSVKLGISNGVKTEILEGLNEKQQVVLQ